MIEMPFLDREGNPIAGKVPVSLHIQGRGLTENALETTRRGFFQFATAYGLSLATSMREELIVDGQTRAIFQVNQGVFTVDVLVNESPPDVDFFGGIVLQIERLPNNIDTDAPAPWWHNVHHDYSGGPFDRPRGPDAYPSDDQRELIPDSVRVNPNNEVVSGVTGGSDAPTDTLIFQIAAVGSMAADPVATGVVKIFRIREPLLGYIASYNLEGDILNGSGRYVVSASSETEPGPTGRTRLNGFYLCGQALDIPPTPWQAFQYNREFVRLYTLGFEPTTFADGNEATGTVLLIYFGAVLVYDMAAPALGWQVVTEIDLFADGTRQAYGDDFEVTTSNDTTTITCSGSDLGGALSGFTVTVRLRNDAQEFGAGFQLASAAALPETSALRSFTQNCAWTNTLEGPIAHWNDARLPEFWHALSQDWTSGISASYVSAAAGGGRDVFVGGTLNPRAQRTASYGSTSSRTVGAYDTHVYFIYCAGSGAGWDPGDEQYVLHASSITETDNVSLLIDDPRIGTVSYSFARSQVYNANVTAAYCASGFPVPATVDYPATPTAPADPELTSSGNIGPDTTQRYAYMAMDEHRARRALRQDKTRGGTWFNQVIEEAPFTPTGVATVNMSAVSVTVELLDRLKKPAFSLLDFTALFPGGTSGAGAFNTTFQTHSYTKINWADEWYLNSRDKPDGNNGASAIVSDGFGNVSISAGFFAQLKYKHLLPAAAVSGYSSPDPPPFAPYVGSFSAAVSVNGATAVSYSAAEYAALGDILYTILGEPIADQSNPWPTDSDGRVTLSAVHWSELLFNAGAYGVSDIQPDMNAIDDRVYVDGRTGGYIAQVLWEARMVGGADSSPYINLVIGNDEGCVPLVDVLNEWSELNKGADFPAVVYDRVLIRRESARQVALI